MAHPGTFGIFQMPQNPRLEGNSPVGGKSEMSLSGSPSDTRPAKRRLPRKVEARHWIGKYTPYPYGTMHRRLGRCSGLQDVDDHSEKIAKSIDFPRIETKVTLWSGYIVDRNRVVHLTVQQRPPYAHSTVQTSWPDLQNFQWIGRYRQEANQYRDDNRIIR